MHYSIFLSSWTLNVSILFFLSSYIVCAWSELLIEKCMFTLWRRQEKTHLLVQKPENMSDFYSVFSWMNTFHCHLTVSLCFNLELIAVAKKKERKRLRSRTSGWQQKIINCVSGIESKLEPFPLFKTERRPIKCNAMTWLSIYFI